MPHDNIWHSQWLILRYARQAQNIVYVTFAMFSKHSLVVIGSECERVPGNGLLFIESMWCLLNNLPRVLQWSQRMTLKQDIFLIYICRQIIQNCFLISYYNNIAVIIIIIIIIIQLLGTNSFSSRSKHGPLRNMHYYLMMIEHAHRDAVAKHRINDITHVWYRWYDVLPLWKYDVVSYGLYQWRYSPYRAPSM